MKVSGRRYLDASHPGGLTVGAQGTVVSPLSHSFEKAWKNWLETPLCLLWSHQVNQAQVKGMASATSQPCLCLARYLTDKLRPLTFLFSLTSSCLAVMDLSDDHCLSSFTRLPSPALSSCSCSGAMGLHPSCLVRPLPHVCFGVTLGFWLSFA